MIDSRGSSAGNTVGEAGTSALDTALQDHWFNEAGKFPDDYPEGVCRKRDPMELAEAFTMSPALQVVDLRGNLVWCSVMCQNPSVQHDVHIDAFAGNTIEAAGATALAEAWATSCPKLRYVNANCTCLTRCGVQRCGHVVA